MDDDALRRMDVPSDFQLSAGPPHFHIGFLATPQVFHRKSQFGLQIGRVEPAEDKE
jgi:hypothetical protein